MSFHQELVMDDLTDDELEVGDGDRENVHSPIIFQHFGESLIDEFNNRDIRVDNVNKIIRLCDFVCISPKKVADMMFQKCAASPPHEFHIDADLIGCTEYAMLLHKWRSIVSMADAIYYGLTQWIDYYLSQSSVGACNTRGRTSRFVELAALYGHVHCIKHLMHSTGCSATRAACHYAIEAGQCECLQYLHEVAHCSADDHELYIACKHGRLDCLKYLCQSRSVRSWPEGATFWYWANFDETILSDVKSQGHSTDHLELSGMSLFRIMPPSTPIDISARQSSSKKRARVFIDAIPIDNYTCIDTTMIINQLKCVVYLRSLNYFGENEVVIKG